MCVCVSPFYRLCIRNLKKTLSDNDLRNLCIKATKQGLSNGLVGPKDMDAQLRAQGVPIRLRSSDAIIIPNLNNKPSTSKLSYLKAIKAKIMLDNSRLKDGKAQSRGYGFVEFLNHGHALACLRELNNNPEYFDFSASNSNQVCRFFSIDEKIFIK